ncbi:MAG: hypothetical protein FJ222_07805 [Lentisphaerae bacterium]|nr:hypothetical protein [Lentisphaerota bacterium]
MTLLRSRPFAESALALLCGAGLALLLDRPWVGAVTVVCFLLPAWYASLIHAWRFTEDLAVTLDPIDPDPAQLASAFRSAAAHAAASGAPATLCIRPVYVREGGALPVMLTLNAKRQVLGGAGGRIAPGFTAHDWLPRHPLPIQVGDSPVWVRFTADPDKRLSTRIVQPLAAGPALVFNGALCAAILPVSGPAALAAAAALLLRHACLRSGMDA